MPRAPATETQIAARREAILDAAMAELAERGYRRATVRGIAGRAGVADGTLYNYFEDKEALLAALLERLRRLESRKVELGTRSPGDLRGLVEAWVRQRLEAAWSQPQLLRAVLPVLVSDPDLRARYREGVLEPALEGLEAFLERARASGRVRQVDVPTCARVVSALTVGLALLRLLEAPSLPSRGEELAAPVTDLLLDGLLPAQPPIARRPPGSPGADR